MPSKKKNITTDIKDSAHKIWLAGLGALAVTEEEGSKLFNNLVSKGEKFEGRRKGDLKVVKEKANDAFEALGSRWDKVENTVDQKVGKALDKLGLPSRSEIQTLVERVEELTEKLNKVEKKPVRKTAKKRTTRKTA